MTWLLSWIVVSITFVVELVVLSAFVITVATWAGWLTGVI